MSGRVRYDVQKKDGNLPEDTIHEVCRYYSDSTFAGVVYSFPAANRAEAVKFCNELTIAVRFGYECAQANIREALGMKED